MGRIQKRLLIVLAFIAIGWVIGISIYLYDTPFNRPPPEFPMKCPSINLVYTWVNGSDPEHIKSRIERAGNRKWAAPGNNRFRDLGGLLYSLRSAEVYAPWVNKIFVVTSGQVPSFLNMDHPQIRLIFHKDIFKKSDDLPTFNSNAIEANFHNLPDEVGPCFIYLNDDMFFANHVSPSDFYDEAYGQILYTSTWTAPPSKDKLGNLWHRSILNSNRVLDSLWGEAVRHYASHGPYFFSLEVLQHMYSKVPDLLNSTSSHPFRHENDAAIPFLYNQWAEHYFPVVIARGTINQYMKLTDDAKKAKKDFDRILARRPKTVCMNDALDENSPSTDAVEAMHDFFHKLFPSPSKFEK